MPSTYKLSDKPKYKDEFSNVDKRPNKLAKGFQKNIEKMRKRGIGSNNTDILRLAVHGTLDSLATYARKIKQINKEHPTERGYYKKVFVLSDYGKSLLNFKKIKIQTPATGLKAG